MLIITLKKMLNLLNINFGRLLYLYFSTMSFRKKKKTIQDKSHTEIVVRTTRLAQDKKDI